MGKILLFYKYVSIQYPKQIQKWLQKICSDLGLRGRIIVAQEGINGTVGGTCLNTDRFIQLMDKNSLFDSIDFKQDEGDFHHFPRLQIKIKDEIVHFGTLNPVNIKNTGTHLNPAQAHMFISTKAENLVILDARNNYESAIGKFQGALTPNIENFRDLPAYIDKNLEKFADKEVLMYCTGGIRCEKATAYLQEKNIAKAVYQIEGGIQRYVEQFPEGYFRGKNYVFDGRIAVKVNDDIVGLCYLCNAPCDEYTNCLIASCNRHFICCAACMSAYENCCSNACQELLSDSKIVIRKKRIAIYT